MKRNTKKAFKWMARILKKHKLRFSIWGGFAGRIYGSKRELADIDFAIKADSINEIIPKIKRHIVYGPRRYNHKPFDLMIVTLNYCGQEIDLCYGKMKIFDKHKEAWEKARFIERSAKKAVYGEKVLVVELKELIRYKKKISRKVDVKDVRELSSA